MKIDSFSPGYCIYKSYRIIFFYIYLIVTLFYLWKGFVLISNTVCILLYHPFWPWYLLLYNDLYCRYALIHSRCKMIVTLLFFFFLAPSSQLTPLCSWWESMAREPWTFFALSLTVLRIYHFFHALPCAMYRMSIPDC